MSVRRCGCFFSTTADLTANQRVIDGHLRIRTRKKTAGNKFQPLNLHARIEAYAESESTLGAYLMAVKWLGNTASHEGSVSRGTLLDAFEILEHTLSEMLARRSKAIAKLAKKMSTTGRTRAAGA